MGLFRPTVGKVAKLKAKRDVAALTKAVGLGAQDEAVSMAAARALATLDEPAAMAALVSYLNDITAPGYAAVSNALTEARGPASIGWIVNALAHPAENGVGDGAERRLLEHLQHTGSERLVDLVAEVMTERDVRVDRRAPYLAALSTLSDDRSLALLREASEDRNRYVREAAFDALARRGYVDATSAVDRARYDLTIEEPVPAKAEAPAGEPADLAGARACAGCGASVLTTREFVAAARDVGFEVDPLSGDATYTMSGAFAGVEGLALTEREQQRRFDAIEARRGYVCRACGRAHCTSCLMSTPRHPGTGGPRCPSCREGPHAVLDD